MRRAPWLLPFLILLATIVGVPLKILEKQGLPRYLQLQAELQRARERTIALRSEVRSVRLEMEALRSDPAAIEWIAREHLGYVRSDEIIFQFRKK